MSFERALKSAPSLSGGSGHPHVTEAPWSPERAIFIQPSMAQRQMEAERLQREEEMKTPEMKRADRLKKANNWGNRVIFDRGNGWKPIWGSAKDEELRIYTLVDRGPRVAHRFWGIKPIGMDIDEFWDKYDPEVKRYDDRQQETPVNPDAPVGPLIGEPPKNLTAEEAATKPVKRQNTPDINSNHGVRKSTAQSQKLGVNQSKRAETGWGFQQNQATEYESLEAKYNRLHSASKAKAATKDVTMPPKRPRGRPPVERKPTGRLPKQKNMPAVKEKAGVQKSRKADRPGPLASIHKMRTRGKGPAELLRLP